MLSNTISTIDFDDKATRIFGKLKSELKAKGHLILDADIMIASIALANQLILVTNNTKHFRRIPGLTLENWSE